MTAITLIRTCLALAAIAAATTAATPPAAAQPAQSVPDFFVDEAKLPFDALPGTTTTRLWGVHKGAGYRVEVPFDWNGDLVMYAHGFRGDGPELTVSNPRIREYLVTHGYAWAASSYAKNRYDVKAGVQDTVALAKLFNGLVGHPHRTYITGHSMGGHVTGVALEQHPQAFDGALPMCGVMGDYALFDYFLDFNLVAQALAGVPAEFPTDAVSYPVKIVTQVVPALGAPYPDVLSPAGLALAGVTQNLTGGPRPAFAVGFNFWNSALTQAAPGFPFLFQFGIGDGTVSGIATGNVTGNLDTVYQIDADPALSAEEQALNAAVLWVAATSQGRHPNGLANIPPISGDLPIPVLSLHTLGDLFVPFSMEQIYARRAAAHGKADLLVSRAYRDIGHCAFLVAEEAQAFADLVSWVETGMRPDGDAILDPPTVADPDFGCAFTLADHPFLPACP